MTTRRRFLLLALAAPLAYADGWARAVAVAG